MQVKRNLPRTRTHKNATRVISTMLREVVKLDTTLTDLWISDFLKISDSIW